MKIISGGQIGADIAALRAAKKLDFETGGWLPLGYRTLDGPHPEYADLYGCIEAPSEDYPTRTRLNVNSSDCTIHFAYDFLTRGERCTLKAIQKCQKPHIDISTINPPNSIEYDKDIMRTKDWLKMVRPQIINVAGNANKSIEHFVETFLIRVFS